MTYFFAVQISPNMIQLTIKNIIIKKQLNFFSQNSWCSILYYCLNAIGWFTDVPPLSFYFINKKSLKIPKGGNQKL